MLLYNSGPQKFTADVASESASQQPSQQSGERSKIGVIIGVIVGILLVLVCVIIGIIIGLVVLGHIVVRSKKAYRKKEMYMSELKENTSRTNPIYGAGSCVCTFVCVMRLH